MGKLTVVVLVGTIVTAGGCASYVQLPAAEHEAVAVTATNAPVQTVPTALLGTVSATLTSLSTAISTTALTSAESSLSTPTPTSSPNVTATPTPTVTSALTATPVPTVSVNGLSLPDPHAVAPELFDLTQTTGPIVQFVDAMKMVGLDLDSDQVNEGLDFQVKDQDGNPYVVMVVTDVGDPLFDATPLLMAAKDTDGEWHWKKATIGKLAERNGTKIRLAYNVFMLYSGNKAYDNSITYFNGFTLSDGHWYVPYAPRASLRPLSDSFEFGVFDQRLQSLANNSVDDILFFHLIWGFQAALPDWLKEGDFTSSQSREIAENHITEVMKHFKGRVTKYVVVNEPWGNPWDDTSRFWHDRLDEPNQWVPGMFRTAHQADPSAELVLNDFGVEIPGSRWWNANKEPQFFALAKQLKDVYWSRRCCTAFPDYCSRMNADSTDSFSGSQQASLFSTSLADCNMLLTNTNCMSIPARHFSWQLVFRGSIRSRGGRLDEYP